VKEFKGCAGDYHCFETYLGGLIAERQPCVCGKTVVDNTFVVANDGTLVFIPKFKSG
jgi:hypothetical protein